MQRRPREGGEANVGSFEFTWWLSEAGRGTPVGLVREWILAYNLRLRDLREPLGSGPWKKTRDYHESKLNLPGRQHNGLLVSPIESSHRFLHNLIRPTP